MLNNKIQNFLLVLLVLLVSLFIVLVYCYLQPRKDVTQPVKYTVNWQNSKDNTQEFKPYFQEVLYATPSPTHSQSDVIQTVVDWVHTDDTGLINYAGNQFVSNSLWPLYNSWTLSDITFTDKDAPNDIQSVYSSNAKSYMKYQTLGYESWNQQGHLSRQKLAYTGSHYIRMIDGRMLVALGQYYSTTIGQYLDIELEDGTILACILGDIKATVDTDPTQRYCIHDNSVLEFIIDSQGLDSSDYSRIKALEPSNGAGNYSMIPELQSPVKTIRLYDKIYEIDMSDLSNDNPDTNDTRR